MKTFYDFYKERTLKTQKARTKAPVFFDGIMDEVFKEDLRQNKKMRK